MRLLVIGGSDAGISAGLRARELDPTADVTLLVADRHPNFSICGIPYHVSGDVPDWRNLAHRTTATCTPPACTCASNTGPSPSTPTRTPSPPPPRTAAPRCSATTGSSSAPVPSPPSRRSAASTGSGPPTVSTSCTQGRVAGANAVGGDAVFAGSLGTQAVKVFDRVVAGTGLRDDTARAAGYDPITVAVTVDDHKAYYPGATPIQARITGDRSTGRLLGAQLLGHRGAEIAKRVDIYAIAISYAASVADITDLALSYTPPLGSPWDAVQAAALAWQREPGA
ncbi:hypothetical protein ACPPVO_24005 [Dactylosporangium sp. McL0621]|uniref:hypothetical protein n=1 Tax=Dactylosporangium sp. McL0621 TaxID=3415678 RepID=UPI003CF6A756